MISSSSVSFTGDFSPNFDLKNMISTGFFMEENDPHSPDFEELVFNRHIFMIKFQ